MNPWIWLASAIVLETGGTFCMKLSEGFSRVGPTIGVAVLYVLSFGSLIMAVEKLELSTAYATWSGLGTALIAILGMAFLDEKSSPQRIACIAIIVVGVVGLHLTGGEAQPL